MWDDNKARVIKYMNEVSEFFAGNRHWGEEYIDEELSDYFTRISTTVEAYEYSESTKTGRKISKLLQALEDLQL